MSNYNNTSESNILIIIGMHRSGTSLTASLLQSAGLDIGDNLMGAAESNQKGHFEDLDFVCFHEKVLRSQGISKEGWTLTQNINVPEQYLEDARNLINQRNDKSIWGWKDPRTTLFLDFWLKQLPSAKFLLIYRSPWEVIDSLFRRSHPACDDVFFRNPVFALDVWQSYNQAILNFYQKFRDRCILVDIETVINQLETLIDLINSKLGIKLTLNQSSKDIYDQKYFHQQSSNSHRYSQIKYYFPEAIEIYKQLIDNSDLEKIGIDRDFLDNIEDNKFKAWLFQDWIDIRKKNKNLQETQTQLKETQTQLHDTQTQLQDLWKRWEKTQTQLQQAHAGWERSQIIIQAMETSKFWQLRTFWFKIKQKLGLSID